jgi:CRP-like cAMP-binding protein
LRSPSQSREAAPDEGGAALMIAKLERRDALSPEERHALRAVVARTRTVAPGEDIVKERERPVESAVLVQGFACRYQTLGDGGRQITDLHVPGDFVDLPGFLLKRMDHSVGALTACTLALVPHDALRGVTEAHPHLTRLLWLSTLIDGATHREWLVGLGRRNALARVAHLLCELFVRLEIVGLARDNRFELPLRQTDLADALGLSPVHMNRVLQELRRAQLITWQNGVLVIHDWAELAGRAEFDPCYLLPEREPR